MTGSGTATSSGGQGGSPGPWVAPAPAGSVSTTYGVSNGQAAPPNQSTTFSCTANATFTVGVSWVPTGTSAADPQPTILRVTEAETPAPAWSASGYNGTSNVAGTGMVSLTGATVGTTQYTMPGGFTSHTITYNGKASVTVVTPPNVYGSGGSGTGFNYSVSAAPITASIVVDQDQQVLPVAATTRFSATINASGFTIDSVKISVDGTPTTATVNPNNANNYYINWPQTGGNPSEHTVTATAQIHDSIGALTLNSTDLPNRQYATSGMGRPADNITADVHLQSIKFNSNIALNQDAVTPVPSPEITWTGASSTPTTNNPAAYIQGSKVNLTLLMGSSSGAALTGNATMGYLCKLQASPNTTNPSTNQADPVLTLYDNTTASPTVPASCSASTTVAATTALNAWVSSYTTSFPVLTFYVEFTKIPTPTWSVLSSYNSYVGNTVYATVATPSAPMATPWVGVLNYACNWAKRTTSATPATTALTTGLYNSGHYNGGSIAFTSDFSDGSETFHLKSYLASSSPYALYGQCDDFSDFLVCLSNALGARPLKSQRSATLAEMNAGSRFYTKAITASPAQTSSAAAPVSGGWSYHQWTNDSTIFDGSIRFGGVTTPADIAGPAFGSLYNTSLVDHYQHSFNPPSLPVADWDPQSAFVPTIAN